MSPTRQRQLPLPLSWRTLAVTACLLHALPCLPRLTSGQTPPPGKFKAAVYEHAVILPQDPEEIVTRAEALRVMQQNLDVYAVQAAEAERQGADILVFPEDGLYGFRFSWESLTPYLEFVPDPTVVDWVPCDDPGRFPNTEVQRTLSCLAKNHSLFLVANMGDRQPCHPDVLPNCNHHLHLPGPDPPHGSQDSQRHEDHLQYNTDVAFDPAGKLVARYHKQNLFYEKQFDTPVTPELSTFDTPFGRWGMFTCFDILFHEPAVTLVTTLGVANIAFPTAWMDALPLLASVQFHSAFARGLGVNFLAANIHLPQARFQGSGVYTPKGMAAFVHNATVGSQPRLIVTEVDVLDKPEPEGAPTGSGVDWGGIRGWRV
ncbi:LOW QUALITY PROTEIN: pantetheinase-like [Babylonia areolata]|uniref:LOW QUALITY PROTEIN: pantetheinase-like n=1 Tax=Babylonia areolata TaxID=304850 RepID=UPI003FD0219F